VNVKKILPIPEEKRTIPVCFVCQKPLYDSSGQTAGFLIHTGNGPTRHLGCKPKEEYHAQVQRQ
jgi:hypothetical protein